MPGKARIDAPNALHHVICRGIEQGEISYDDTGRNNYSDRLGGILKEISTSCYAWARLGTRSLNEKTAKVIKIKLDEIWNTDKPPQRAKARGLVCFWTVRELGWAERE